MWNRVSPCRVTVFLRVPHTICTHTLVYVSLFCPLLFFILYAKIQTVSHPSIAFASAAITTPLEKNKWEERGVERIAKKARQVTP